MYHFLNPGPSSYLLRESALRRVLDEPAEPLIKLMSEHMPMQSYLYTFSRRIDLAGEKDFYKYCKRVNLEGLPTWSETFNEIWQSLLGYWRRRPKLRAKHPTDSDSENPVQIPSSTTSAVSKTPASSKSYPPSAVLALRAKLAGYEPI